MRYLLDVNALVAFGHTDHLFHARVVKWAATVAGHDIPEFATCPITELGFVRVMSQVYGVSIVEAKALLGAVKEYDGLDFEFVADDHGASRLPSWVFGAKQTTDGHLLGLASANGCVLATLDEKIPGAFVIP